MKNSKSCGGVMTDEDEVSSWRPDLVEDQVKILGQEEFRLIDQLSSHYWSGLELKIMAAVENEGDWVMDPNQTGNFIFPLSSRKGV